MVTTADLAVSAGQQILDVLASKARRILACNKVVICFWTQAHTLDVCGSAGCEALRTGQILRSFTASRDPDGSDGHTNLWDGEAEICGEPMVYPAVLKIVLVGSLELGYLISGNRALPATAMDVTIGLNTARQCASVIIEHFRPDLRRG